MYKIALTRGRITQPLYSTVGIADIVKNTHSKKLRKHISYNNCVRKIYILDARVVENYM